MQATSACDDCVVALILSREPDDAVVLSMEEHLVLRRLAASGLVPEVRYQCESL